LLLDRFSFTEGHFGGRGKVGNDLTGPGKSEHRQAKAHRYEKGCYD
jgi:hypothetical protein